MFEVKNTKQEQVKVTLSEQLPLSTDERIKVRMVAKITNSPRSCKIQKEL